MATIKKMVRDLAQAMNKALEESEKHGPVREALNKLGEAGYNVKIVLEAAIGYTKPEEETERAPADQIQFQTEDASPESMDVTLRTTAADRQAMRKLGFDPALRPPKEEKP